MTVHEGLIPSAAYPSAFEALRRIASDATRLRAAVAFVTESGVELIRQLQSDHPRIAFELVARGAPITDPEALLHLAELGTAVSVVIGECAAQFHPKLWMGHGDGGLWILAGSGNLTAGGLRDNDEQFELLHVAARDATAIAAHDHRFAQLTAGAVPLDDVRSMPYWNLWRQQLEERRSIAAQERKLDETLSRAAEAGLAVEALYADLVEFYERTKNEVRIPAPAGGTRPYVASYFKRAIDQSHGKDGPVPVVAGMVKRKTEGFNHLADQHRPDLMVEQLVVDTTKPYHRLFTAETVAHAQRNLDDYYASRPKSLPLQ